MGISFTGYTWNYSFYFLFYIFDAGCIWYKSKFHWYSRIAGNGTQLTTSKAGMGDNYKRTLHYLPAVYGICI